MRRILIIAADLIIVYASFLLTFILLKDYLQDTYAQNFQAFLILSPFIGLTYIGFTYIFGLYNSSRKKRSEVIYTVCLISISLTVTTMAMCYFIQNGTLTFPRSILLVSMLLYTSFLCLWHSFEWKMAKRGHGVRNILVVGKGGQSLSRHINENHGDIYNIKFICDEDDPELWKKIDQVKEIFVTSKVSDTKRDQIFHYASEKETNVFFVPKYTDISIINATLYKTDDIPTYRISKMKLTPEEVFVKRAIDVTLSGIALLIFSPVFLLFYFLTQMDGGPAFYAQERLTIHGRKFKVFKFRSMVPNAEKLSGPTLADEDDPRITKIGKLMRATRVDELPQLINILIGDMSIVGPRPERPFFVDQFDQEIPDYHNRLKVKAGLTGLAQIMGKYNTHVSQKLRYDLMYINNYSIFKDILIMMQTVKILFMKSSTEGVKDVQKVKGGQTVSQGEVLG